MMGKRRILAAVLAAAVATAGVVRVAVFYRSGQGVEPFATDRALQNNQVLFPGEDTAAGDGEQGSEENDSFWKEKNAEDAAASGSAGQGYLFGRDRQLPEGVAADGLLTDGAAGTANGSAAGGTVYDVTGRADADVDLILPGGNGNADAKGDGTAQKPGGSGVGDGDNTPGGDDSGNEPVSTPNPTDPTPGYGSASRDELSTGYVPPTFAGTKDEHFGSSTVGQLQKK